MQTCPTFGTKYRLNRWKLVDSECVARDVKESRYITSGNQRHDHPDIPIRLKSTILLTDDKAVCTVKTF